MIAQLKKHTVLGVGTSERGYQEARETKSFLDAISLSPGR